VSWVCGTAATSALNPQADFRRPDAVSYTFLNQPQQAAYFRAFADDSLGSTTFADIAKQHLRRAAEDAGWSSESWHDAPVFIGSSSYAIAEYENRRRAGDTDIAEHGLLYLAKDLRKRSGNRQIFSLATACTSSAHALIQADNCLRGGADRAFVLGIENLNRLTLLHFHSLGLFTERYRPFGGNGLILGEGVAALALSATPPDCAGRLKLVGHAANTSNDLIQSNSKALEQVISRALNIAAVAPECAQETVGIRPGEKLHEQMIGAEDSWHTYEYPEHFKILPAINGWDKTPERIKDGKPVPEGFVYASDNNSEWMSQEELQAWIAENQHKIGKI